MAYNLLILENIHATAVRTDPNAAVRIFIQAHNEFILKTFCARN